MDNENFINIISTFEITSDPEFFEYEDGKRVKQVFEVISEKGNKATCVSWDKHKISIGDKVRIRGRLNKTNNFIIVFKETPKQGNLLILKRAATNETK